MLHNNGDDITKLHKNQYDHAPKHPLLIKDMVLCRWKQKKKTRGGKNLCGNPADTALESSCRHKKEEKMQSTNIHCTTWSIYIRGRSKPKSGNQYPLHIMVTCMATDQLADDPLGAYSAAWVTSFEEIIHDFSHMVPSVYIRIR